MGKTYQKLNFLAWSHILGIQGSDKLDKAMARDGSLFSCVA
jgi:hypothetical protein